MRFRYILLVVLALLLVASVQADWLTGWDYRKSIHINGSSSGDVTNYQVMIGVYNTTGTDNTTSVFLGAKAADDTWFSDIRFTGSDGATLIDIWNETYYSNHVDVWIECPSIDDSTGWDGYIYYGKSGASEVWNGTNTFPFFDHFEGTSINTSKWIVSGTPGTISVSDSILNITSSGSAYYIYGKITSGYYGQNYSLSAFWNPTLAYSTSYIGLRQPPGANISGQMRTYSATGITASVTNATGSQTASTFTVAPGWKQVEIIRNSSTSVMFKYDTSLAATITSNIESTPNPVLILSTYSGITLVDYCFIHTYQYPEPNIASWGDEETVLVTTAFSGTPTSGNTPLTVSFLDESNTGVGNATTWSWVFGDGTISTAQNPSHTYTTSGTYTVNLTVTNSLGSTDIESKTDYITVTIPGTPTADFSGTPTSGLLPLEVQFTDESTGSPTTWNWSFGDGEYSTWQHPIHTYSTAGTYTVILNASNSFGYDTHSIVDYITVTEPTVTSTGTIPPTPGDMTVENGGISPFGLVVMMLTTTGMVVYSFADNENRNYLHIVSAGISMLLAFVAGVVLMTGMVTADVIVTSESVTVNESVYGTYAVEHVAITDTAVGWFWIFVGVVMLIITILGTIEALSESHREVS